MTSSIGTSNRRLPSDDQHLDLHTAQSLAETTGEFEEMIEAGISLNEAVTDFENKFIMRVLERTSGNLSRAAKMLGIHRATLARKMHEYKVKSPANFNETWFPRSGLLARNSRRKEY